MVSVKRGDVLFVRFDPVVGCEQGGVRPALVVQNDVGNRHSSTTIVVAITTKFPATPYPFMVSLPQGSLPRPSAADCAQIRTMDLLRFKSGPIAHLDEVTMRRVDEALKASLGL